ncbi:hypothetical protein VV01_00360 [Luteipulveratus halotolerans]|uniref:DUF3560 domain-containing protein n=1 Tax=Luteipulveratus halotolerans TaxID=1631356 RepID=A0A0L6CPM7_9MICO|nr:hypothetical protein VV01_00360 [Luteipulveratus halotolerans]
MAVTIDATPRGPGRGRGRPGRARKRPSRAVRPASRTTPGDSDAAWNRAEQINQRFAGGQPILVGHHSQRGAERDQERAHALLGRSVEQQRQADEARRRAETAASEASGREEPHQVARRIDALTADVRRLERQTNGRPSEELDHARAQLEHWRHVRAQQVEAGQTRAYTREDIAPGDLIQIRRNEWERVTRVNAKTVTVYRPEGWNVARVRYHQIRDHRRPSQENAGESTT